MADRIRIIPHFAEGIPDVGSFEVWFADGRTSEYFYWDDNPGRASITRKMDRSQAKEAVRALNGTSWNTPARYATAADGSARSILISRGKVRTRVPAVRPAHPARPAIGRR